MKAAVIYKIINTLNNKFYVGSTNNQYERFRTHRTKLRKGTHHCAHLQAAWNKYGESAFIFHVIELLNEPSLLQEAEDKWLTAWVGHSDCYNHGMRSGAPWRGVKKELHPMYGKEVSAHTKQLIRDARLIQDDPRTGKTHSEETKERIRKAKLANPSRAWLGKTRDEETRKKIGDTQRGVTKAPRQFTEEGLRRAQENMRRVAMAHPQEVKPFDAVFAKFPQEVQDKYDFTNAEYTGALNRIEKCLCPTHGLFSQYAAQFRKGRGCPSCGADARAESKRKQMKEAWATEEGKKTFLENRSNKLLAPTP
jgi:group I intron endonuclease